MLNIILEDFEYNLKEWNEELDLEENEIINSSTISPEDKLKAEIEATSRRSNLNICTILMNKFLNLYEKDIKEIFIPAVSIDSDGEISFEWYGRLGARAMLLFQITGKLYLIVLYHGEHFKVEYDFNNEIPEQITFNLNKIYIDKISDL